MSNKDNTALLTFVDLPHLTMTAALMWCASYIFWHCPMWFRQHINFFSFVCWANLIYMNIFPDPALFPDLSDSYICWKCVNLSSDHLSVATSLAMTIIKVVFPSCVLSEVVVQAYRLPSDLKQ